MGGDEGAQTLPQYAGKIHFPNPPRNPGDENQKMVYASLMKIESKKFQAPVDGKIKLKKWPTRVKPFYHSKEDYKDILTAHIKGLREQQGRLYAHNRYSLLLIFQAMDAAGKDGAIKHVMSGVNPQGCQVFSFKHPSAEELAHDFLWRTTRCLPERGRIGIFNRSYYEEVLIVRVHPEILRAQALPEETLADEDFWKHRFRSINNLEKHLHRNGTRVIKFFLHMSKEEQRRRFLSRIEDSQKNWKLGPDDIAERGFWNDYMAAYEACLSATSTHHAPWHIVPADDKENARLIISQIVLNTLESLKLGYPKISPARRKELQTTRKALEK
jgi:PPK2 family polyphosphate:nucleotide phosphotransferase